MSVRAMSWVFEHARATLGARLVLLALADYAHDDGTKAFPSVDSLGGHARMTRRAVQSALRKLEADGEIEAQGTTRHGTTIYRITGISGGVGTTQGAPDDRGGVVHATDMSSTTPNPSVSHQIDPSGSNDPRAPSRVDGKPVTGEEARFAVNVLASWNAIAGQKLQARSHLSKIIMRHREHPALGLDKHREAIEAVLHGKHWWEGEAGPNLVYGNDGAFERALQAASSGKTPGSSVQSGHTPDYAADW